MSARRRRRRPPTLLTLVNRLVRDRQLFGRGDRVLCACSGGPDSNALLHAVALLRERIGHEAIAVGIDHGLRPEAAAELDLARAIAQEHGVPFFAKRVSVSLGADLQARARHVRHLALQDLAVRHGATVVATGHTADDRAETVLMRLLRGAGPRGLAALPARAKSPVAPSSGRPVELVRPLLLVRRPDVLAHLNRHGLSCANDPTNQDRRFLRARVRHDLLPNLQDQSPRIVEHLCALADMLAADLGPNDLASSAPDLEGLVVALGASKDGTGVQDDELTRVLAALNRSQRQTLARWVRLRKGGSRLRVAAGKELELRFFSGTPVIALVE